MTITFNGQHWCIFLYIFQNTEENIIYLAGHVAIILQKSQALRPHSFQRKKYIV